MKKFLGFVVMSLGFVLPLTVNAAITCDTKCGDWDENGVRTCVLSCKIDEATPKNKVDVTFTEFGGAEILSVDDIDGEEFQMPYQPIEIDDGFQATVETIDAVSGEYNLLKFQYKRSGTAECKVKVTVDGSSVDVPDDEPGDPKPLGSTLPYIALGAIALVATGAYITTKNKAKMYKI